MRRLRLLIGMILVLAIPVAAIAANNSVETNVSLTKGDNRTGTYYVSGQNITVDGNVAGDVVCAGQTVVINGAVGGDVICGAQTLTVNGPVSGSVRAVGQVVTVNGTVGRNVTVSAQSFVLGNNSRVGGDVAVAAQITTLSAPIGQAAYLAATKLDLNSTVAGSVTAYVETLSVGSASTVAGNFDYTSQQTFSIDKSKVQGQIVRHAAMRASDTQSDAAAAFRRLLYWIVAGLLGALLTIWIAPRFVRGVTNAMVTRWRGSLAWGAVALFAGPPVLILLTLTVVGLPGAAVLGNLWLLAVLTSGLFAGVAVGRLIWQRDDSNRRALALASLAGIPFVILIGWIPVVSTLVGFIAIIWTLGGMVLAINRARLLG